MLKEEASRMKELLVEAISTLCRSGIRYNSAMRVEGLIGITVDEEDIMLVNVNREFGSLQSEDNDSLTESQKRSSSDEPPRAKRTKCDESSTDAGIYDASVDDPAHRLATGVHRLATGPHVEDMHVVKDEPSDKSKKDGRLIVRSPNSCQQDQEWSDDQSENTSSSIPYGQNPSQTSNVINSETERTEYAEETANLNVKIEISDDSDNEDTEQFTDDAHSFGFPTDLELAPVPMSMYSGHHASHLPHTMPSTSDLPVGNEHSYILSSVKKVRSDSGEQEDVTNVTEPQKPKLKYTCEKCPYQSTKQYNLKRHQRHHSGKIICDQCGSGFLDHYNLNCHIETKHNNKKHLCDICGREYRSQAGLNNHIQMVHQKKFKFSCEICGRGFRNLVHYRGHINAHLKIEPELCSGCGKTFTYKQSLNRHEKICGKGKKQRQIDFPCTICGGVFRSNETLAQHLKGKHEHGQYKCTKCQRSFNWRSSLSSHSKQCTA